MRPTVLLFDIDGTLVNTGGAGRRSMTRAFGDVHGARGEQVLGFSFAGMTDRAIVRTGLASLGDAASDETEIDRVLVAYLERLADEVPRSEAYRVLPGVPSVLAWVASLGRERPGTVAIGLGTGNVKAGAYTKLARGALDAWFAFGGFGSDAEDRTELLRIGALRGASALDVAVEECRVVIIGDTPKDVSAARGIGAECVAVGTGGFEPRALLQVGAIRAFATLEDEGVREALLPVDRGAGGRDVSSPR